MEYAKFDLSSADGGCDFVAENDNAEIDVSVGSEFMSVDLKDNQHKVNIYIESGLLLVSVDTKVIYRDEK